jgi:predicted AlkP superfamily phosphohydrolase/phosphomutase
VIVGLDGMPYRLIRDLAQDGTMPKVRALVDKGVLRQMASSIPEISSVAWSSIITGTNPAQHGIFGFTDLAPGTYRRVYPNFASLKKPPFWDRREYGRCVILNVPSTYPARTMNGVLVAGFVALNLERATYPPALVPKLEEVGYRVDVDVEKAGQSMQLFLNELDKTLQARIAAYRYLWHYEAWDTFMFVFTGTDRLAHYLWDAYEDGSHPYHGAFLDHLRQVDEVIGEMTNRLSGDDRLILLSDHGFELLEKEVYVNFVLQQHGLLAFEQGTPARLSSIAATSKAFALDPGRIYVHLKGKYPRGGVFPEDQESLLQEVQTVFESLSIDGQRVIKCIYRKEEIYAGPLMDRAPDLVLLANPGFNLRATINPDRLWDRGSRTGKHTQEDAFLLVTGDFDAAIVPRQPSVVDIVGMMDGLIEGSKCRRRTGGGVA